MFLFLLLLLLLLFWNVHFCILRFVLRICVRVCVCVAVVWLMFQHGRSDSYRVATIPSNYDDNKTADGRAKVYLRETGLIFLILPGTTFTTTLVSGFAHYLVMGLSLYCTKYFYFSLSNQFLFHVTCTYFCVYCFAGFYFHLDTIVV